MVEAQRYWLAVGALLCARDAAAQTHRTAPAAPASTQRTSMGDIAEQRMRAGDCEGALDAFDAALQTSTAPQLHRDRGSCHDKLGHPYPAIEDYRAYLTERPNAPDADRIRARVVELESQVGIVRQGQAGVSDHNGADVSTSIGGETDLEAPTGGASSLEMLERNEQLESQADSSPLRRGRGFIIGLAVGGRDFSSSSFGAAELAGIELRYSLSHVSTLLLEPSVTHVNGGGTVTALSGPGIMGGYEARLAFNSRVSDALLVGATFRFESLSEANGYVYAVLEPEGRVGYRHVFGPALGLEAVVDGGVAFATITSLANASSTQAVLGGHVAVLLGF
jgi:hypothetical protein